MGFIILTHFITYFKHKCIVVLEKFVLFLKLLKILNFESLVLLKDVFFFYFKVTKTLLLKKKYLISK